MFIKNETAKGSAEEDVLILSEKFRIRVSTGVDGIPRVRYDKDIKISENKILVFRISATIWGS